jgi:hypothetical protein
MNEMRYPLEVFPSRARGHSVGSGRMIASTKQPGRTIGATWLSARRALRHLERRLRPQTDVAFGSNGEELSAIRFAFQLGHCSMQPNRGHEFHLATLLRPK